MPYVSPLSLTPEQRAANLAALNARMRAASDKVMRDPRSTKTTRAHAARINASARRVAREA